LLYKNIEGCCFIHGQNGLRVNGEIELIEQICLPVSWLPSLARLSNLLFSAHFELLKPQGQSICNKPRFSTRRTRAAI